jgi:hypothetical protein
MNDLPKFGSHIPTGRNVNLGLGVIRVNEETPCFGGVHRLSYVAAVTNATGPLCGLVGLNPA